MMMMMMMMIMIMIMIMMIKSKMSNRTTTKMMRNKVLKIQKILRGIVWVTPLQALGMIKRTLENLIKY